MPSALFAAAARWRGALCPSTKSTASTRTGALRRVRMLPIKIIDCDTDKQAIEKAKRMVDGRRVSLGSVRGGYEAWLPLFTVALTAAICFSVASFVTASSGSSISRVAGRL